MELRVPDYYEQFQCIASACQDNCCIGWEIDIDEESEQRYRQVTGSFGMWLRDSIQNQGELSCFRLVGERCAFLNDENLCDLILNLGVDALCQVCRDHPRFTETFGALRETGVGLCCEEAARLLLSHEEAIAFCARETEEEPVMDECDPERLRVMLEVRTVLFTVMQNRSIAMAKRMYMALELGEAVQSALETGDLARISAVLREEHRKIEMQPEQTDVISLMKRWVEVFSQYEAINESWTALLNQTKQLLSRPEKEVRERVRQFRAAMSASAHEWEHLMVYFLFRYFLKSVYTGDCLTPIQLAVVSCILIGLLDLTCFMEQGGVAQEGRIRVAGLYSKEMEYSEENWAALEEAMIFDSPFFSGQIKAILSQFRGRD